MVPCAWCGHPKAAHKGRSREDGGPGICPGTSSSFYTPSEPTIPPWTRGHCSECGDDILLTRTEARLAKDIVGICDVCHGHKAAEGAMDAVVADLQRARVDLQEVLYHARAKHGDDPEAYAHLERLLALTEPE